MSRRELALYTLVLIVAGAGWGITQPLSKIAVSTGHGHFGLVFWQMALGAAALAGLSVILRRGLPFTGAAIKVYVIIALIGSVIPNSASYQAIAHLPAGVMSILMSLIPMLAFPMALALGLERFTAIRFAGLLAGLSGVLLLALPEASLPEPGMLAWIPLAMVAPVLYAFEGNYVARWGTAGLDPVQVLFGASFAGAVLTLPVALASGQFISPFAPFGAAEWALIASALVHVTVYTTYVWLIGRAGAVFSAQVSYLVTGFGVFWAMLILSESYSPYIWAALALVLLGVLLVQPRRKEVVATPAPMRETGGR